MPKHCTQTVYYKPVYANLGEMQANFYEFLQFTL